MHCNSPAKLSFVGEFHDIFVVIHPFTGQIVLHNDLSSGGWSPDIMGPLSLLMLPSSEK